MVPGEDLDIISQSHEPNRFNHLVGEIALISIEAEKIGYLAAETLLSRIKYPGAPLRSISVKPSIIR